MKITTSAIIGSLSGSSGDVTASSWKGRGYVRRRVTPKNPKSVAQTAQRMAMKAVVALFQGLPSYVKTFLNKLGTERQLSGANVCSSASVKAERTNGYSPMVPSNTHLSNILGFTATTGGASGQIAIAWTAAGWTTGSTPKVFTRLQLSAGVYATPWQVATVTGAANMTVGTGVITTLTPGSTYAVLMMAEDASSNLSGGVNASAASHA